MAIKEIFQRFWNKNDIIFNVACGEQIAAEIFYKELAIHSAINIIAKLLSNAEIKTYIKHKEVQQDNYYLFNIEPNKNQNASEFTQKWVSKLIYDNEVLIVQINNELFVADSFKKGNEAIKDRTYTNVVINDYPLEKTFLNDEVMYMRQSNEKIKSLIDNLYDSYGRLIGQALQDYRKSKAVRGRARISATWSKKFEDQEKLKQTIMSKFRSFFDSDNSVLPEEEGFEFVPSERKGSTTSEEIKTIVEEIFDIVAIAFNIPKCILKGELEEIDGQKKNMLSITVKPIAGQYEKEIIRKYYGKKNFLEGTKARVDISRIEYINIFDVASGLDVLTRIGFSHNDLLKMLNEEIIQEAWANRHYMTKNYQEAEGGEKNEGE